MATTTPTRAPQSRWPWPFEVLDQIGEGGMGVVYRARYVVNGRHVALKMLPSDVTDKTVLARFEREVEVLKNLKHPNIVRCFGGSCEDTRRFYAMELIEGGTLEQRLQEKGKLPWEQVIYFGLQICAALECSHGNGVVHRDIKPSNFLVTASGQIKLSDFGLASVEAARKITAAGKTAGTFLYMAPEQIRGLEVTAQTDLYALGCVLYELLTGSPPFVSDTPAGTLHQHCQSIPPHVCEKALDCPAELDRIVDKLLQKNPADRYASATALAADLKRVTQAVTVIAPRTALHESWADRPKPKTKPPTENSPAPVRKTPPGWLVKTLIVGLFVSLACNVLGPQLNSRSARWEELWLTAATDNNLFVRQAAVSTLAEMASESQASRELLLTRLDDLDPTIRKTAVEGLQNGGSRSNEYIPQLLRVQQYDHDADVRSSAMRAIAAIQTSRLGRASSGSLWLLLAALAVGTVCGVVYWLQLWKSLYQEAISKPVRAVGK